MTFTQYIDINKDGHITDDDLKTCLRNLNSQAFFKDGSQALSGPTFNSSHKFFLESKESTLDENKILQVCNQIKEGLTIKKMSILALWNNIDKQKAGLINLNQLIKGVNTVIPLSGPILEKLFSLMDTNVIGMVDYEKFNQILTIETSS